MPRLPRAARVFLLLGAVVLLAAPATIAAPPTHDTPGTLRFTNTGIAIDGANATDLYTYNATAGGRLYVGNHTTGYLSSAAENRIDSNAALNVTRPSSTDVAYQSIVTGDNTVRHAVDARGNHTWGPGNGAVDVAWYRHTTGMLRTDGDIVARSYRSLDNNHVDLSLAGTGGYVRLLDSGFAFLRWGPAQGTHKLEFAASEGDSFGTANLHATSTSALKTDGSFAVGGALTSTGAITTSTYLDLEDEARPTCDSSARGRMYFNEVGAGSADILYMCMKKADDTYAWQAIHTAA